MALRKWQTECSAKALNKYMENGEHFLCLATPGAGKTRMAAEIVQQLFSNNKIDFVICFAPSVVTANGMQKTIETFLGAPLNGRIGAKGMCVTYQSLSHKDSDFWNVFKTHRVFAVFDEIHHCGGNTILDSNIWAQHILVNVQNYARFTLALSGTPWRSDNKPVTLSKYSDRDGKIYCDYEYGLAEAIRDSVCRTPFITVIDNDRIVLKKGTKPQQTYKSIQLALESYEVTYQNIVETPSIIEFCLKQSLSQLVKIKRKNPLAAGLVVATSVEHAHKISDILNSKFSCSVTIVTYHNNDSAEIISNFQHSTTDWLVAVGMVSEGTNIPRLQVCCHLTRIKTELHFRQVLGRIMRVIGGEQSSEAHLFTPAQPKLIEYSKRLTDDVPGVGSVKTVKDNILARIGNLKNKEATILSHEKNTNLNESFKDRINVDEARGNPSLSESFYNSLLFKGAFSRTRIDNVSNS